jgi:hypothetical protein
VGTTQDVYSHSTMRLSNPACEAVVSTSLHRRSQKRADLADIAWCGRRSKRVRTREKEAGSSQEHVPGMMHCVLHSKTVSDDIPCRPHVHTHLEKWPGW